MNRRTSKGVEGFFYHVNGHSFGPIPKAHLECLRQGGLLSDETFVFLEETSSWEPISSVIESVGEVSNKPPRLMKGKHGDAGLEKFRSTEEIEALDDPLDDSPEESADTKNRNSGWQVAFILTIFISALGFASVFFWAIPHFNEMKALRSLIGSLEKKISDRESTISDLKRLNRKILNSNEIQGRFEVVEPDGNQVAQVGSKIFLFRQSDIENFLNETIATSNPAAGPSAMAEKIVKNLPFPLASTATDSDGFYRIEIPEKGELVLHTNIISPPAEPKLWFIAFNPDDPRHAPINFTSSNTSPHIAPGFIISNAR